MACTGLQMYADMRRCGIKTLKRIHIIGVVAITIAEWVVILADKVLEDRSAWCL